MAVTNDTIIQRARQIASGRTNLVAGQRREQEGLFGGFEKQIAGQEKLSDAFGRFRTEAGLPQSQQAIQAVQGQIFNTKDLLDRLKGDIGERTEGTFTTEAQARRLEASESADLNTQLGRLATGLTPLVEQQRFGREDVATRIDLLNADQQKALSPVQLRIEAISDRFARELTNYDRSKELELDAIIDKLQRQQQLSDREWQKAAQLAATEREFQLRKEEQAREQEARQSEIDLLFGGQGQGQGQGGVDPRLSSLLFGGLGSLSAGNVAPQASPFATNLGRTRARDATRIGERPGISGVRNLIPNRFATGL